MTKHACTGAAPVPDPCIHFPHVSNGGVACAASLREDRREAAARYGLRQAICSSKTQFWHTQRLQSYNCCLMYACRSKVSLRGRPERDQPCRALHEPLPTASDSLQSGRQRMQVRQVYCIADCRLVSLDGFQWTPSCRAQRNHFLSSSSFRHLQCCGVC